MKSKSVKLNSTYYAPSVPYNKHSKAKVYESKGHWYNFNSKKLSVNACLGNTDYINFLKLEHLWNILNQYNLFRKNLKCTILQRWNMFMSPLFCDNSVLNAFNCELPTEWKQWLIMAKSIFQNKSRKDNLHVTSTPLLGIVIKETLSINIAHLQIKYMNI